MLQFVFLFFWVHLLTSPLSPWFMFSDISRFHCFSFSVFRVFLVLVLFVFSFILCIFFLATIKAHFLSSSVLPLVCLLLSPHFNTLATQPWQQPSCGQLSSTSSNPYYRMSSTQLGEVKKLQTCWDLPSCGPAQERNWLFYFWQFLHITLYVVPCWLSVICDL